MTLHTRALLSVPKRMMVRPGFESRSSSSIHRAAPVFATQLGRRPFVNHNHQHVHENIGHPLRFSSFSTTTSCASLAEEDSVPQTLRTALTRQILPQIAPNDTTTLVFLVGVSGGCDSVALLHSLMQVVQPLDKDDNDNVERWRLGSDSNSDSFPCHIDVAHFDHEQRGVESTGDCQFVQELCRQYRLPLHVWRWSEDDHNNGNKPFSQDMARTWRRHRMERRLHELVSAHESAVGVILTAHHRDDSMESLLLKLLRGAHITNLRGMEAIVEHDHVWYARPLLNVSKQDLIVYLQQHDYPWREDASNQSNKYLRNRVRNELIPLLSNLVAQGSGSTVSDNNHLLYKRLQNLEQQSQEVQQDLKARSQRYLDDDNPQYFALDPTLRFSSHLDYKFALYEWMRHRTAISYEALERVSAQIDEKPDNRQWRLGVTGGVDVVREGNVLFMVDDNCRDDNPMQPIRWQRLTGGEEDAILCEEESAREKRNKNETCLDIGCPPHLLPDSNKVSFFATTCGHVHDMGLRFAAPWWSDDRQPIPIKEFLRGQKVSLHQRASAPVIVMGEGNTGDNLSSTTTMQVVAVFVPSKDTWILAKPFSSTTTSEPTGDTGMDSPKPIRLRLFVSSSP